MKKRKQPAKLTADRVIRVGRDRPFKTIRSALKHVAANRDLADHKVTIRVDGGTYAADLRTST